MCLQSHPRSEVSTKLKHIMLHKNCIYFAMDYCNSSYLKVPIKVKWGTILPEFKLVLTHLYRKTRYRAHNITCWMSYWNHWQSWEVSVRLRTPSSPLCAVLHFLHFTIPSYGNKWWFFFNIFKKFAVNDFFGSRLCILKQQDPTWEETPWHILKSPALQDHYIHCQSERVKEKAISRKYQSRHYYCDKSNTGRKINRQCLLKILQLLA